MNFKSDNTAAVCPEIIQALIEANAGHQPSYAEDIFTKKLQLLVNEIFETKTKIFFANTGTAANSLALSAIIPPHGAVFCHTEAHIQTNECNAPEFFTDGAKLLLIEGKHGKISPKELEKAVHYTLSMRPLAAEPSALSVTQSTEQGSVYTLDEIKELTKIAHDHHMLVHMDGARFTNGLVSLNASPAEITWRSGVDVLCLSGTKNGAMIAEMIVFFNQKLCEEFDYHCKRAGQLASKSRYIAAQFLGLFKNDLWLKNAAHANQMAKELEKAFKRSAVKIIHPVEANEVFVSMSKSLADHLHKNNVKFSSWGFEENNAYRFVASWMTEIKEITNLESAIQNFKS